MQNKYQTTYQETTKKKHTGLIICIVSVVVIGIIVGLVFILGKGSNTNKKGTTEKNTELKTTEEKTTEEKTTEENTTVGSTTEGTTTEVNTNSADDEEVLVQTFEGVTYGVPAGFTYAESISDDISLGYYHEDAQTAFMITVYPNDTGDVSLVQAAFDSEIKATFGDSCLGYDVGYNDYLGKEWDISNEAEGYSGYSLLFCDEETIIYIEYISYVDNILPYYDIVYEISY